jgi:hypothetical protein
MPRQTPSASDYTSVVRSSAIANDVASKPAGSAAAAKAAGAAVRGGGGLGSLGAIGSIVKQSVVARSIARPPSRVEATVTIAPPPLLPLQLTGGTSDAFVVAYTSSGAAIWTAKISSIGTDIAYSVTVDSDGNVYVSGMGGYNEATSTISAYNADGTPFATTLPNVTYGDAFIVKYNTTGVVQWIVRIVTSDIDAGFRVTTDSNNNVYMVGRCGSAIVTAYNADKTPFSTTLPNTGSRDAFLVKYNSGGLVQWITRVGSSGTEFLNLLTGGISTDSSGNVYIAGQGGSGSVLTAYNGNSSSFATTILNSGNEDTFIIKYSSSGNVQWVTRIAGAGVDDPYGLATDSSGNLYIGGVYDGTSTTLTLYNSDRTSFSRTLPNSNNVNGFIAKYNSSGFVQWGAYIGNVSTVNDTVYGICTDSSGNLYVTGTYTSACPIRNFDGTTYITMQNSGTGDAYVAKYDPNGNVQWAGRLNYCTATWGIYADSSGGIYVVGETSGTSNDMTAYSANGTETGALFGKTLTKRGSNDAFIVKFNTSGAVQWLTSVAGTASDAARSVTVDNSGKLYIAGSFASSQLIAYSAA